MWAAAYTAILTGFTAFVLLDTFAITKVETTQQSADTSSIVAYASESGASTSTATFAAAGSDPVVTDTSYTDENMSITLTTERINDTDVYIADIQVSSAEYLKTAFAQAAYGRNLTETTSGMAEDNNAVLAINGDYYGFRDTGYVIRNGVLYRDTPEADTDALVIYGDGSMASVNQSETSAEQLLADGAWQVLSFGPTLIENGEVVVGQSAEVSQAQTSNPRTAIGMVSPLHYIVVVSDGRTSDNAGLSLYELAQVFKDAGATYAYNLDGGGSSTLYFNGKVVNTPASSSRSTGEREVSDIVYFG